MAADFIARGVPIDGNGFQGHIAKLVAPDFLGGLNERLLPDSGRDLRRGDAGFALKPAGFAALEALSNNIYDNITFTY